MFHVETRNFEMILKEEIPKAMAAKFAVFEDLIHAVLRFTWRKNYELMLPVLKLGQGKSFGELAVQKEVNIKIAHKPKPRAASVLCRTDCKFAVMSKSDYQSVLDNLDRRKVDKLKEFFR